MLANTTLLRMKYARIISTFAKMMDITLEEAVSKFYKSRLFLLVSQGVADMHCLSDYYLAEELKIELEKCEI